MRKCDNLNGIRDFAYCRDTRPEYPFTTTEFISVPWLFSPKQGIKKPSWACSQDGWYLVHPKETAGYQTFPGRNATSARRNLSGISRNHTSPNTINIFKWYPVILRYNLFKLYPVQWGKVWRDWTSYCSFFAFCYCNIFSTTKECSLCPPMHAFKSSVFSPICWKISIAINFRIEVERDTEE